MTLLDGHPLRETTVALCEAVRSAGGRALLVGGSVRDCLLGQAPRDLDLEVFFLDPAELPGVLSGRVAVDPVGRSFPVWKVRHQPIDVATPVGGAAEAPESAALRRDFTINAIAFDPLTGEIVDPRDGRGDLAARRLRHTSDRFAEDPLRVLRGMQLVARFGLTAEPETVEACRRLRPDGIPPERVLEEWRKLLLLGVEISRGLAFLADTGWRAHFPELEALAGCPQDPTWHPEGDVWVHTLHCLDVFARERIADEREDFVVGLAVLCHDLGKPATTRREGDGRITSLRHEPVGARITRELLGRLTTEAGLVDDVARLVAAHLAPVLLFRDRAGDAAVRRLARRVGRIDRLVRVASADQKGRPPLVVERFEAGEWLLERARALAVADREPVPIVKGRHLIKLGLEPGPGFGPVLDACLDAQIEGRFATLPDGLEFARRAIARARRSASRDGRPR